LTSFEFYDIFILQKQLVNTKVIFRPYSIFIPSVVKQVAQLHDRYMMMMMMLWNVFVKKSCKNVTNLII